MSTSNPDALDQDAPTGLRALLSPMERAERQELFERIEAQAIGGPDYYVMMALSATLASLGLLQDSTAVVIGAMLVAPLMGPLVAAGLALVQGNLKLMRSAISVALLGIALALVIASLLGAINPGFEPTMEVEARGRPGIFDLFVALTSGMIAAYAQCRTSLSNTIAGVAIAAALLPPLAAVGIAAMISEYEIAFFASVLLMTNVVAIILGTAIVFRVMGMKVRRADADGRPWARRALATLVLFGVLLTAPLMLRSVDDARSGQTRPASYPVSLAVRNAVAGFLEQYPDIHLINMARHTIDPESRISAALSTEGHVPVGFRRTLRNVIREARGVPLLDELMQSKYKSIVRVYVLQEAPSDTAPPTAGL
jgi:uncharacterized hydrophobic protein (TIGR00271 family)